MKIYKSASGKLVLKNGKLGMPTKVIQSLYISVPPTKVEYDIGESLDLTGMVVHAQYNDGYPPVVVNNNDLVATGFDSSIEVTGQSVLLSYQGESTNININVVNQAMFTYTIDDNDEVTITNYSAKYGPDVVIPETIEDLPVTDIAENAFKNKSITSVYIPDCVENIGTNAFAMNSLQSVIIGHNTILNGAPFGIDFENTYSNETVKSGRYVWTGSEWFRYTQEKYFTRSSSSIASYNILGGTDVSIPPTINGVTISMISASAFKNKSPKLTKVSIPSTVTMIRSEAFKDNSITDVIFNSGLTNIEFGAFENNNLTSVTLPPTLVSIGGSVFQNNPNLNYVWMPQNANFAATTFGQYTDKFSTRYTYTSKASGPYVLDKNTYLSPTWVRSDLGYEQFFGFDSSTQTITGYDKDYGHDVVIPSTINDVQVKVIGVSAFESKELTSVVIPDGIITISNYAFRSNTNLSEVTIPTTVTSIGAQAFISTNVYKITMPNNVTIASGSFNSNFHYKYTWVGKKAGTYEYNTPEYPNLWNLLGSGVDQFFKFDIATKTVNGYDINLGTDMNIPNTLFSTPVENIGDYAFRKISPKLTSVQLPNTLKKIGTYAFDNALLCNHIVLPDSVTTVEAHAFFGNTISAYTIPYNVTFVGGDPFVRYPLLGKMAGTYRFNNSVEYPNTWLVDDIPIAENFFGFNVDTKSITGYDNTYGLNPIIPNQIRGIDVENVESYAFDAKSLTGVTLPNTIKVLKHLAFKNNAITQIVLPSSLTTLDGDVFYMNAITNVTIGDNVTFLINWDANLGNYSRSFRTLYESNGKLAGVYTYDADVWTKL